MTAPNQPDAFIYLPGLAGLIDQSGSGITKRLAQAIDRSARSGEATYVVDPQVSEETFGVDKDLKTKAYSIKRHDANGDTGVVDVYELDYRPLLTKKYADQNILRQTFHVFWILVINFPQLFRALQPVRRAKGNIEKVQVGYAVVILVLSIVYFFSLAAAAYKINPFQSAGQPGPPAGQQTAVWAPKAALAADPASAPAQPGTPPAAKAPAATAATPPAASQSDASGKQPQGVGWAVAIVIFTGVVEVFWPGLKQGWSAMAAEYLAAMEYLGQGTRKAVVGGQLTDLVEHLVEKQKYRQIHLLTYSFGTVVALDSIFPAERQPGTRFAQLHTLITIGCPYDLIRLFWPQYFQERHGLENVPQKWLNVYNRRDFLASNFRDDEAMGEADEPIDFAEHLHLTPRTPDNLHYSLTKEPEKLGFLEYLNPFLLQKHGIYWEPQFESELTCFSLIVTSMYEGDAILQ